MWLYEVSCHSWERRNGNQPCLQAAEGKAAQETEETDVEEVWNSCPSTLAAHLKETKVIFPFETAPAGTKSDDLRIL